MIGFRPVEVNPARPPFIDKFRVFVEDLLLSYGVMSWSLRGIEEQGTGIGLRGDEKPMDQDGRWEK